MRLLIVEDERRLGARLAQGLREDGFAVDLAADLSAARDAAIADEHDLVLLDLNLPDGSGLDLLREWRDEGRIVPVLILTSRDGLEDKIDGLDAGADDYMTKPFELAELLARVRALLRRRAVPPRVVVEAGSLRLDRDARRATVRGEPLSLTLKELALLEQFLLRPGVAVSRETLAEHVWDESYEARSNVIDVLVGRLRRKLEAAAADARLRAVAGVGWALDAAQGRS